MTIKVGASLHAILKRRQGEWEVMEPVPSKEGGIDSAEMETRTIRVPTAATPAARATRWHEQQHIAHTQQESVKAWAKALGVYSNFLNAAEDVRVNSLGLEEVRAVLGAEAEESFREDLREVVNRERMDLTMSDNHRPDKALLATLSALSCMTPVELLEPLPGEEALTFSTDAAAIIAWVNEVIYEAKTKFGYKNPEFSVYVAKKLTEKAKKALRKVHPNEKIISDGALEDCLREATVGPSWETWFARVSGEEGRDGEEGGGTRNDLPSILSTDLFDIPAGWRIKASKGQMAWGVMTVRKLALTTPNRAGFVERARPSEDPNEVAHPQRWRPWEGMFSPFRGRKRTDGRTIKGVSVLVDGSGSMGWGADAIKALLEGLPSTVVGVYGGSGTHGSVVVVAEKGKRADVSLLQLRHLGVGGGNIVDGPALLWLSQQKGPRFWVSDGQVTGVGDNQTPNLVDQAGRICSEFDIKRVSDLDGLITSIEFLYPGSTTSASE